MIAGGEANGVMTEREAFLIALARSGLVDDRGLESARSCPVEDVGGLAEALIARGLITPFQSQVLRRRRAY